MAQKAQRPTSRERRKDWIKARNLYFPWGSPPSYRGALGSRFLILRRQLAIRVLIFMLTDGH